MLNIKLIYDLAEFDDRVICDNTISVEDISEKYKLKLSLSSAVCH